MAKAGQSRRTVKWRIEIPVPGSSLVEGSAGLITLDGESDFTVVAGEVRTLSEQLAATGLVPSVADTDSSGGKGAQPAKRTTKKAPAKRGGARLSSVPRNK